MSNSVEATTQLLYNQGLFDKFENKNEICKVYIIFNTRRGRQKER